MLDRKLLRDLAGRRGLVATIAAMMVVGVLCYVGMQSVYRNLLDAQQRYYRQSRMPDVWVEVQRAPTSALRSAAAEIPQIAASRTRIRFPATADLEADQPVGGVVVSLPDVREPAAVAELVMRRGDYFAAAGERQVIVNDAFARARRLHPGDPLVLVAGGRRESFRIVGTAISSEFTYLTGPGALLPDPEHYGVFFVPRSTAEELFEFGGAANELVARLAPGQSPAAAREALDELRRRLDDYGVLAAIERSEQSSHVFLIGEIEGLGAFASFMPAVFLGVAAVVLNVLVSRLVRQDRSAIGTLKALGYSDRRIAWHYVQFGGVVGLAAGVVGAALGIAAAAGMTVMYRQYFEFPELPSRLHPSVIAVGVAISIACAMAGSLWAARGALRLPPAEAMRTAVPVGGGAIPLERFGWLWRRLGYGWRLALRNLWRHPLRAAAAVLASAAGATLLVTGLMMFEAQNELLSFQFSRVQRSDFDVMLKGVHPIDAVREIERLPGVDRVEPRLLVPATLRLGNRRRDVAVVGLQPGAVLTRPRTRSGQVVAMPPSGLVLSRRLAERLGVGEGETLEVAPREGDQRPFRAVVESITDSYVGTEAYARLSYLSDRLGHRPAVNSIQLGTDPRPASTRQLLRRLREAPEVESVVARRQMVRRLEETILNTQWAFIIVLIAMAGVVYLGGIVNASVVSLSERQRELATLAAIGYSPWQLGGFLLRDSLVCGVLGTAIGMPAGWMLMHAAAVAYETEMVAIPVVSRSWIWLATAGLGIAFIALAQAIVQWMIFRMNVLAALQVKE